MNTKRSSCFILLLTAIVLLASACQPVTNAAAADPTRVPMLPSATTVVLPTQAPTQPYAAPTPAADTHGVSLNLSGAAQGMLVESLRMPTFSWWVDAPLYRRVTLLGYPAAGSRYQPRIYIYPAADLVSVSTDAANTADHLRTLLQTRQAGDKLPFLPLITEVQIMHPQMRYLDFKSGTGVRFLTQYNNGLAPVNNSDLFYTFQGLTHDGQYYVAVVMPVTHPDLPADSLSGGPALTGKDYLNFIASTAAMLDQQPAGSFSVDLAKLDALVQSIEIQ